MLWKRNVFTQILRARKLGQEGVNGVPRRQMSTEKTKPNMKKLAGAAGAIIVIGLGYRYYKKGGDGMKKAEDSQKPELDAKSKEPAPDKPTEKPTETKKVLGKL